MRDLLGRVAVACESGDDRRRIEKHLPPGLDERQASGARHAREGPRRQAVAQDRRHLVRQQQQRGQSPGELVAVCIIGETSSINPCSFVDVFAMLYIQQDLVFTRVLSTRRVALAVCIPARHRQVRAPAARARGHRLGRGGRQAG
jgi:hypothetical protein